MPYESEFIIALNFIQIANLCSKLFARWNNSLALMKDAFSLLY